MKPHLFIGLLFFGIFASVASTHSNTEFTQRNGFQVADVNQEYAPKLPISQLDDLVSWMVYNHLPPSRKLSIPHNMAQKATIAKNDTIDFAYGFSSSGGVNMIGYGWTIYGCDSIIRYIPPCSTEVVADDAPWIKQNLESIKYEYTSKQYRPNNFGGKGRIIIENDSVKSIRGIFFY